MSQSSAGERFRALVAAAHSSSASAPTSPLMIVGTVNAYCALLAREAGHRALYLSGAGVANASLGLPDLGITQLADVVVDAQRITAAVDLPLLVDVDTGWGSAFNIARTVREMERAGVAAIHMEDQVQAKRCGHRPNKALVSAAEMSDRVRAAVDARHDDQFVLMARTDALASEGMAAAVDRANAYVAAGADMIFAEAMRSADDYRAFVAQVPVPVLANITEFGQTPLLSVAELGELGVAMALYPLTAFRAMNQAALEVYQTLSSQGHQSDLLARMQDRETLYRILGYHDFERKLDALFDPSSTNPKE